MPDTWRAAVAEFMAVFILVFVALGSTGLAITLDGVDGGLSATGVISVSLANGLAILVGVVAFRRVSGAHINPAITAASVLADGMSVAKAGLYVVFQLSGAIAAAAIMQTIFDDPGLGVHRIYADHLGTAWGFGLEAVISFMLGLVVFASAVDRRSNPMLAPLAIGAIVTINCLAALPLTGASMNPARSFGPSLVGMAWTDHWIYWAAPVLGASAAGVMYALVFGDDGMRARVRRPRLWMSGRSHGQ